MTVVNQYQLTHIDVKNAIVFTVTQMKHYYNLKHTFKFFETEDIMNLQLHQNYSLSSLQNQNKKLNQ